MIVGKRLQLLLFLVAGLFIFSFTQAGEYAEILEKGKYVKKECFTLSDKQIPSPNATVNQIWRMDSKPTGFFHTQKQNDRWWIIDPDGYAFISIGINSVLAKSITRMGADTLGFDLNHCRKLEKPMDCFDFMSN